jgi:hypothetical protein
LSLPARKALTAFLAAAMRKHLHFRDELFNTRYDQAVRLWLSIFQ